MKNILLRFFAILILTASNILIYSCKIDSTLNSSNPYTYIANEMHNGKIVMLGETQHYSIAHYEAVDSIIQKWMTIQLTNRTPRKLFTLVLEIDSVSANTIDQFVNEGDISTLNETLTPFLRYETIEFFYNLRAQKLQMDSLNRIYGTDIGLVIKGFEDYTFNFDKHEHYEMSKLESEKWFVNERDLHTSERAITYIKNNANSYVLFLYGAAHLYDGYISKIFQDFEMEENQAYGYYLAHFLKKEFGNENVISIILSVAEPVNLRAYFPVKFKNRPFLEIAKKVKMSGSDYVDYFILSPGYLIKPHNFNFVFSGFIIDKLIWHIKYMEKYLPGHFAKENYYESLNGIFFINGNKYKNSAELEKWRLENTKYNGFDRINSNEFENTIYEVYVKSSKYDGSKLILYNLGLTKEDFEPGNIDSVDWHNRLWPVFREKIKFINAVGIYWVGYDIEKNMAKQFLIDYTGENYKDPIDYMKWFRSKYYKVEY